MSLDLGGAKGETPSAIAESETDLQGHFADVVSRCTRLLYSSQLLGSEKDRIDELLLELRIWGAEVQLMENDTGWLGPDHLEESIAVSLNLRNVSSSLQRLEVEVSSKFEGRKSISKCVSLVTVPATDMADVPRSLIGDLELAVQELSNLSESLQMLHSLHTGGDVLLVKQAMERYSAHSILLTGSEQGMPFQVTATARVATPTGREPESQPSLSATRTPVGIKRTGTEGSSILERTITPRQELGIPGGLHRGETDPHRDLAAGSTLPSPWDPNEGVRSRQFREPIRSSLSSEAKTAALHTRSWDSQSKMDVKLSSAPSYQHRPLEKSGNIRLISISPSSSQKDQVMISFKEATFKHGQYILADSSKIYPGSPANEVLEFDALSWAWGREPREFAVLVTEGQGRYILEVSAELLKALKELYRLSATRVLWVDALCINYDDRQEVSTIMSGGLGRIFSHAKTVPIWLDCDTTVAKYAFDFVNGIESAMDVERVLQADDISLNYVARGLDAFLRLCNARWFSRRWIVQEVLLPSPETLNLHCGNLHIPWTTFSTAVALFAAAETRTKIASKMLREHDSLKGVLSSSGSLRRCLEHINHVPAVILVDISSRSNAGVRMSAEYLLSRLSAFVTSKRRDSLYAVVSVAKNIIPVKPPVRFNHRISRRARAPASEVVRIDYSASYADLCRDFVKLAVNQTVERRRALDVLCRSWAVPSRKNLDGLSSWIGTLNHAPIYYEPINASEDFGPFRSSGESFVGLPEPETQIYSACGDAVPDENLVWFQSDEQGHRLYLTGYVVDEIEGMLPSSDGSITKGWFELGGWSDPEQDPPEQFWRTIVANRGLGGSPAPQYYGVACKRARALSRASPMIDTRSIIGGDNPRAVVDFATRVGAVVGGRKLMKTKFGRLGLVSGREKSVRGRDADYIKAGDLICVLHGCSVPVVLKKREKTMAEVLATRATELREYDMRLSRVINRWWSKMGWYRQVADRPEFKNYQKPLEEQGIRTFAHLRRNQAREEGIEVHDDTYYEFWGECYVHGLMEGEAPGVQRRERIQNEVLELR
jgi:hypothetical protein